MFLSLSLRLRTFLLFLGAAVVSCLLVGAAHYFAFSRLNDSGPVNAFLISSALSVFAILAVTTKIWLLFDEHVAKPVEQMAATIRTRAHAGVDADVDLDAARFLGDLGPAVHAVSGELSKVSAGAEDLVAAETAHLLAEKAHLSMLLTEIPVAIILVSPNQKIMLYDGQAADVLGQVHVPRLSASVFDYFNEEDLAAAQKKLAEGRTEVLANIRCSRGNLKFELRLKTLKQVPGYMILVDATRARIAPEAERPLIYDFDFTEQEAERELGDRALEKLQFVVFDTETTGLMPNKDELVQIGAVRVVNGRIIPGEEVDQLVNPGRPIPAASTRVHGITDGMVAGAQDAGEAVGALHGFARDSVLVAHNAPFDMAFLNRHARICGFTWDQPMLDTVLLSAVLFGETEDHSLDALCQRLDVQIAPGLRHAALGDATATAEVLCKMLPILSSRGYRTFGDVITQTRKHGRLLQDLN